MKSRTDNDFIVIWEVRPFITFNTGFLNHTRNVSKLIYESSTVHVELRSIALDTFCSIELELALRN